MPAVNKVKLTQKQFDKIKHKLRGRGNSWSAAAKVFVDGFSAARAADVYNISPAAVSLVVRRVRESISACPACGRPFDEPEKEDAA